MADIPHLAGSLVEQRPLSHHWCDLAVVVGWEVDLGADYIRRVWLLDQHGVLAMEWDSLPFTEAVGP